MRIRTDGDYAHRLDEIDRLSNFYDCNKTQAILYAANDVPAIVRACGQILDRDDLTAEQKREIAETLNDRVKGVTFDVTVETSVDTPE